MEGIVESPAAFGRGVAKGTLSLVRNTIVGSFNAASKVTSTVSKSLTALAGDAPSSSAAFRPPHTPPPRHVGEGLKQGMVSLGSGVLSGVTGLVTKPIEGAKSGGVFGAMQGLAQGVIGVAVRPVAGVLDMASKTTEGIKNTASLGTEQNTRSRPPRFLNRVVEPYQEEQSFVANLLWTVEDGALRKHIYLTHFHCDTAAKRKFLVLTNRAIVFLKCKNAAKMLSHDDLLWRVQWRNIKSLTIVRPPPGTTPGCELRLQVADARAPSDVHCDSEELAREILAQITRISELLREPDYV
eukprot:TRINITY_DN7648_c0_g1_i1.p1 TRINITY_DN7648_c0_g1~~TRINITY_DN7648_c0_g1_i1.p1  ORF type:complete len:297 (+),score=76.80 TRINITY_DN7648_c0_g1_i1:325-1215(+)